MSAEQDEMVKFRDQDVVLDTRGDLLYIGRLKAIGEWFLELVDADVHDIHESGTSKYVRTNAINLVRRYPL